MENFLESDQRVVAIRRGIVYLFNKLGFRYRNCSGVVFDHSNDRGNHAKS
jgi:hypothetical protein